jgi:hypothetical protein
LPEKEPLLRTDGVESLEADNRYPDWLTAGAYLGTPVGETQEIHACKVKVKLLTHGRDREVGAKPSDNRRSLRKGAKHHRKKTLK